MLAAAAGLGQGEVAARLSGAADAIFQGAYLAYSAKHQSIVDHTIESAREQIGGQGFNMLMKLGQEMTFAQVIHFIVHSRQFKTLLPG